MNIERVLFTLALCASLTTLLMENSEAKADDDQDRGVRSSDQAVNPVVQWNRNLLVIVRSLSWAFSARMRLHSAARAIRQTTGDGEWAMVRRRSLCLAPIGRHRTRHGC